MSAYEPCVLNAAGSCTRWSHDHRSSERHSFWGIDPSGYCNCEDCEAVDES